MTEFATTASNADSSSLSNTSIDGVHRPMMQRHRGDRAIKSQRHWRLMRSCSHFSASFEFEGSAILQVGDGYFNIDTLFGEIYQ